MIIPGAPAYITDFGGKGDSDFDNATAISTALASLPATGGVIYFPRGVYNHSGITLAQSHVTLQGEGSTDDVPVANQGTSILYYTGTGAAITIAGTVQVSGLVVRDLAIQGTSSASYGVQCRGDVVQKFLTRSTFERVTIEGFLKSGAIGLSLEGGVGNTFRNCYVRNNDSGIVVNATTAGTTATRITNCAIRVNVAVGLKVTGGPNTLVVDGMSVIEGNQGPGVLLDAPTNVLMSCLTFRDCSFLSNNIASGTYQFDSNTHGYGTNIRQLLLDGCSFWSPGAQHPGDVHLDGVLGAVIGPLSGGALAGKNILKIEASCTDVYKNAILGSSGGAIDPDGRGVSHTLYTTYP